MKNNLDQETIKEIYLLASVGVKESAWRVDGYYGNLRDELYEKHDIVISDKQINNALRNWHLVFEGADHD